MTRHVLVRIGSYLLIGLGTVFFALPLLWLLSAPFDATPTYAVRPPSEFTLDNFAAVGDNRYALPSLLNSVLLAAGTMLLVVTAAALASYALSRVRIPGRDALLYLILLLSSVITGTAAMVPTFLLTAGGPNRESEVVPVYIYNTAIIGGEMGYSGAVSLIVLLINLLLALVYLRAAKVRVPS